MSGVLVVQTTLLLNSTLTLTAALTLTYPGLKRDAGPRLSDLKTQGPNLPLASQRVLIVIIR